jgi:hypothetical protein
MSNLNINSNFNPNPNRNRNTNNNNTTTQETKFIYQRDFYCEATVTIFPYKNKKRIKTLFTVSHENNNLLANYNSYGDYFSRFLYKKFIDDYSHEYEPESMVSITIDKLEHNGEITKKYKLA